MEKISNIFDALRLLNELEDEEPDEQDETFRMQQKEIQDYINVILKGQANKPVAVRTTRIPSNPDKEKEVEVSFVDAVQFYEAIAIHIGQPGFFIKGEPRFSIDALLKIRVKLEKEGISFTVSGKVVWVNPKINKGKPPGIGVKLYKMGNIQRTLFDDFTRGQAEPDMLIALSET